MNKKKIIHSTPLIIKYFRVLTNESPNLKMRLTYSLIKQAIFIALFVSYFFSFFNFNSNAATQPTWIINPNKIPSFDLDKQMWLSEALFKSQIKVVYDKDLQTEAYDSIPFCPQLLTLLVESKHVNVYLITPSLEQIHIGLVVKDMLNLKGEALREFRKMLHYVVHAFHALGYGDYLALCDFSKTYQSTSGIPIEGQCWEMIPIGMNYIVDKSGEYEIAPKIWRNNYIFFNRTPNFKQTSLEMTKQFVELMQSQLTHGRLDSIPFLVETLPWKINIIDLEEAKQTAISRIFSTLQKLGAIQTMDFVDPQQPTYPPTKKENKNILLTTESKYNRIQERKACPFCDKEVLKKQRMLHGKSISVIYNRIAYTKNAHFMIIPTDHKESLHLLEQDEFEEAILLAQNLSFILGDVKDVVWFCQNGPRAGQTVPHSHVHVLRRPDPFYFSLFVFNELGSIKLKPYGEDEFNVTRKWIFKQLKALNVEKKKTP